MTPLQMILESLRERGCRPQPRASGYSASCPAHEDRNPSLSVGVGDDGRALVNCFAGCPPDAVMAALGLGVRDLFPSARARSCAPARPTIHRTRARRRPANFRSVHAAHVDDLRRRCSRGIGVVHTLAAELGVSEEALSQLGIGWCDRLYGGCVSFPMFERGRIVGVRLRLRDGSYRSLKRSKSALFVPHGLPQRPPLLLVTEGVTSTAAALTLGIDAVGLPAANADPAWLLAFVKQLDPGAVLLMADDDQPGRRCATKHLEALRVRGHSADVVLPPPGCRDLRDWLNQGADPDAVKSAILGAVGGELAGGRLDER